MAEPAGPDRDASFADNLLRRIADEQAFPAPIPYKCELWLTLPERRRLQQIARANGISASRWVSAVVLEQLEALDEDERASP